MSLKRTLADSLDDLVSSRTSVARKGRALDALERVLARICVSGEEVEGFLKLQEGFECNVASRLMHSISTLIPTLQQTANSTSLDNTTDPTPASRLVIQSLSILQGVALLHPASKAFLSKKWCIQILVDLLALSRHLTPVLQPSPTNNTTAASNGVPALASGTLDALLCVLVDSPAALRAFEEADGVEVVVKTLKRAGVARDTRIKCLEFLYFYLLDETDAAGATTQSLACMPSSPRTPRKPPPGLAFLRKDLDFVPMTPKKVARLGVGAGAERTPKPGRAPLPVDTAVASSPTKPGGVSADAPSGARDGRRSTQEKKEILGSLLGNVDALVEGVAKSGIWGLG